MMPRMSSEGVYFEKIKYRIDMLRFCFKFIVPIPMRFFFTKFRISWCNDESDSLIKPISARKFVLFKGLCIYVYKYTTKIKL